MKEGEDFFGSGVCFGLPKSRNFGKTFYFQKRAYRSGSGDSIKGCEITE